MGQGQDTLSNRQIILIGAMYTFDSTLISVQSQATSFAKQHIWLAHLWPSLVIFGVMLLLVKLLRRYPGQDLFAILDRSHPLLAKPLILLFVLFFFMIIVRDIRALAEFTNISLLPTTPIFVISTMIAMAVILISRGGIVVLGRMTEIFGTTLAVVLVIVPFVMAGDFTWRNMTPIMNIDYRGVAAGGWYLISYIGEITALAFLCTSRNLTVRNSGLGLGIGAGLLLILAVQGIMVLGVPLVSRMLYPNYELVRHIHLTDFLDRLDLPLVGLWMPTMFVKIGYSLVVVCLGLRRLLPKGSGRALVPPVGFLAFSISFWYFEDAIQVYNFNGPWPAIALMFEVLLPIAVFVLFYRRRGSAT